MKERLETLVVGGGCFWCTEAIFRDLRGVRQVESGYAGGHVPNPTYRQVCSGATGHAECVRITFAPDEIERADLLRIHLVTHDPTTSNRQGGDSGPQYRSVIFYSNEAERALGQHILQELAGGGAFSDPIVTTLEALDAFFIAEDDHQGYFSRFESSTAIQRMGMNSGYCSAVISPKVAKFRKAFADRLSPK